jgi:hypothetical protein
MKHDFGTNVCFDDVAGEISVGNEGQKITPRQAMELADALEAWSAKMMGRSRRKGQATGTRMRIARKEERG